MGFGLELKSTLRRLRRQQPGLFEGLQRHGILFDEGQVSGPAGPGLAQLKERLHGVECPNNLRGERELTKILTNELNRMNERPPPDPAEPTPVAARAVAPAPTDPAAKLIMVSLPKETPVSAAVPVPTPAPAPVEWQSRPAEGPWSPPELEEALTPLGLAGFRYEHNLQTHADTLPGWRVLAATQRGRLHAHHGTFREDAFAHGGDGEKFWVFCVCDGAGSSRLSRIGAAATSRRLVQGLSAVLRERSGAWEALPVPELHAALIAAIVEAVQETVDYLVGLAAKVNGEPKDFRCTLLLTVFYRHRGTELACLSKVGDGFMAGLNREGKTRRYDSTDASGDFSGEVRCFVPDEYSAALARPFTIFSSTETLHALLLCTDGIEDPFYPVEAHAPALFHQLVEGAPFVAPAEGVTWKEEPTRPVACADPDLAQERLAHWLAFEKKGENDDRTALLIFRPPPLAD